MSRRGYIRSGLFAELSRIDGRSAIGRAKREIRRQYASDLGNDLTVGQGLLLDRIASKSLQLSNAETLLEERAADDVAASRVREFYISLSNSFRLDILALGLRRVPKKVPSLYELLQAAPPQAANGAADGDARGIKATEDEP